MSEASKCPRMAPAGAAPPSSGAESGTRASLGKNVSRSAPAGLGCGACICSQRTRAGTHRAPAVERSDLQRAVVPGPQVHGGVADGEDDLALEDVEAFFERVHVRRQHAAGIELGDAQPGVHRAAGRPMSGACR